MIRNMRALRVAIAATSDVGLAGYIDDLGRLNTSSGRTTEAMTKMMNVTQQHADILDQELL